MTNSLVFLGQYPIDVRNSAPKVRTYELSQALAKKTTEFVFVTGTRQQRRWPLLKLLFNPKFHRSQLLYLEAATSTSMEIDFLVLLIARLEGKTIGIYIRDAYPLFDLALTRNVKEKLLDIAWHMSQWFYRQMADVLYFPSQGLAAVYRFKHKELLPPAGCLQKVDAVSDRSVFQYVLYAGSLATEVGADELLTAFEKAHQEAPHLKLLLLSHLKYFDLPKERLAVPWIVHCEGTLDDILVYHPDILCAVIPRPTSDYNNLAMPIKFFDYLSLGLPVISTPCTEVSEFIHKYQCGIVVDGEEGMASGILTLSQNLSLRHQMAHQAFDLIQQEHHWEKRAQTILESLAAIRA